MVERTVEGNVTVDRAPALQTIYGGNDTRHVRKEILSVLQSSGELGDAFVTGLRNEEADEMMELLLQALDDAPLPYSPLSCRVMCLLIQLAQASMRFPPSCYIRNVQRPPCPSKRGGFADLYEGLWAERRVAVKIARIPASHTKAKRREVHMLFLREGILWRLLQHDNILNFFGTVDAPEGGLVSPWMDFGTVIDYVKDKKCTEDDVETLLHGIARGVRRLHQMGIVHGDLRGANVLVDDTGQARLADFGLATIEQFADHYEGHGAIRWMAPELLDWSDMLTVRPTTASDVYAFACVCLELYTGQEPFYKIHQILRVTKEVTGGRRPPRPVTPDSLQTMPANLWRLVQTCWAAQPSSRPSIYDVCLFLDNPPPSDDSAIHGDTEDKEPDSQTDCPRVRINTNLDVSGRTELLGSLLCNIGTFSDIHTGLLKGHSEVAVKVVRLPGVPQRDIPLYIDHPNILPIFGMWSDGRRIGVVSPIGQDIRHILHSRQDIDRHRIIQSSAGGLVYLHEREVVHGAISPDHVLVNASGEPQIHGFVASSRIYPPKSRATPGENMRYMAPEQLVEDSSEELWCSRTSQSADVYSYGMLAFEIMTGRIPFHRYGIHGTLLALVNREKPDRQEGDRVSDDVWALLQSCWAYDPNLRPSMVDIYTELQSK